MFIAVFKTRLESASQAATTTKELIYRFNQADQMKKYM